MTSPLPRACALLAALGLSANACAQLDPTTKPGEWHPSGANEANLVAMVANPADLSRGVQARQVDGLQAAAAVARFRQGNVKALPDSGLAEVRLQATDDHANTPTPGAGGS